MAAPRIALVPDPDSRQLASASPKPPDHVARINDGWRRGRPVEDPSKTKRWGFITAKPSEYLIHMRRGRILRKTTGQGASCFKWPWDSIAIVPTTINRLQFTADQVTLEKVGIQVTGLAVYRIVEPELTFRMLNFSFSERASEKLSDILREMFAGATRRHIANLSVEDAMTRRKEAIASELMRELAPVMSGNGEAHDSTTQGWGVVLDTVEVQYVRVLSERVFSDMQAEYRSRLAMKARQAELSSAQEIAAREAASARAIEEAKLSADTETRELRALSESRATQIELAERNKREALEAQSEAERIARQRARQVAELQAQAEIASERSSLEERAQLDELSREQKLAEAERQLIETRHENTLRETQLEAEREQQEQEHQAALREIESQSQDALARRRIAAAQYQGESEAHLEALRKQVENTVSEDRIRMALVERSLPAVAQAFAQQFGEARFTQIGGAGLDPSAMVGNALTQVLDIARALGLRPEARTGAASPGAAADAATRVVNDVERDAP
ncbi:SPFH domain-containing protein [Haliangium ochraceum]|uniref:Band 7 protein n=1 Tax=Haliangium ochraceum (strain DSM 14365 / JCM 11303 / SMP-2) TaxID=502025 RepID=D0LWL8_HALO1|nr:SPFH domain-containing protein [Haliangium ochraceum]ACY17668.1 band 7 protein [Haliangium ochraceum DSM 14365]